VVALAARQHVVVSTEQLLELGFGRYRIRRRLAAGWLTRLHRGVYRVGPQPGLWTAEMAALLACGPQAVLSHRSAGAVWRVASRDAAVVDVAVSGTQVRSRDGIRVHRFELARADVRERETLRVTSPARTLLDLAAVLPRTELERAVNEAQVLRLVSRAELAAISRRPGAGRLRAALRVEPRLSRSELERLMLALVRRVGLPMPVTNARVLGHEVDFAWLDERVIVETDGFEAHSTRAAFERDRARDALLSAHGWRVLRFSWWQVVHEPEVVAARLAVVLAATTSHSTAAANVSVTFGGKYAT
jgi:very-short-patch-repair endonuclease